jgi:hypothetical protein
MPQLAIPTQSPFITFYHFSFGEAWAKTAKRQLLLNMDPSS